MLRGFTDSMGVEWRVWEVIPSRAAVGTSERTQSHTSLSATAYANGWLCFESQLGKRRLAPIPAGWALGYPLDFTELLRQSTPVPERKARDTRA